MANSNQQGTNERIKEKVEKIKQFARETAKTTSQQMSTDDGVEIQALRDTFQEREQELQQQVEETHLRAEREREEARQQIQALKKEAEVIRLYIIFPANS